MANILVFDIETSPNLVYTWGFYEQTVIKVIRPWYVLTVAYKWLHERTVHVISLHHYPLFKKDHQNDRDLIADVWKLLNDADIVVTQNGDEFDIKKLNTRFLKHGFPPPSPFKSIDTKKSSKKHFSFVNNKLDNLGEELKLGRKMEHEGFPLWERCMAGNVKAFLKMCRYNKQDIILTEAVYLKERPWMTNHPNISDGKRECPKCRSKRVWKRGRTNKGVHIFQAYRCLDCSAFIIGEKLESLKPIYK